MRLTYVLTLGIVVFTTVILPAIDIHIEVVFCSRKKRDHKTLSKLSVDQSLIFPKGIYNNGKL